MPAYRRRFSFLFLYRCDCDNCFLPFCFIQFIPIWESHKTKQTQRHSFQSHKTHTSTLASDSYMQPTHSIHHMQFLAVIYSLNSICDWWRAMKKRKKSICTQFPWMYSHSAYYNSLFALSISFQLHVFWLCVCINCNIFVWWWWWCHNLFMRFFRSNFNTVNWHFIRVSRSRLSCLHI